MKRRSLSVRAVIGCTGVLILAAAEDYALQAPRSSRSFYAGQDVTMYKGLHANTSLLAAAEPTRPIAVFESSVATEQCTGATQFNAGASQKKRKLKGKSYIFNNVRI